MISPTILYVFLHFGLVFTIVKIWSCQCDEKKACISFVDFRERCIETGGYYYDKRDTEIRLLPVYENDTLQNVTKLQECEKTTVNATDFLCNESEQCYSDYKYFNSCLSQTNNQNVTLFFIVCVNDHNDPDNNSCSSNNINKNNESCKNETSSEFSNKQPISTIILPITLFLIASSVLCIKAVCNRRKQNYNVHLRGVDSSHGSRDYILTDHDFNFGIVFSGHSQINNSWLMPLGDQENFDILDASESHKNFIVDEDLDQHVSKIQEHLSLLKAGDINTDDAKNSLVDKLAFGPTTCKKRQTIVYAEPIVHVSLPLVHTTDATENKEEKIYYELEPEIDNVSIDSTMYTKL